MISPGLIFVQKAFFAGLIFGELIFAGAYYWREFCVSKWVGLDNKDSLKELGNSPNQIKTVNTNSPWAYIQGGVLLEGYLHLSVFFLGGGLFSGERGAHYRNVTVLMLFWLGPLQF